MALEDETGFSLVSPLKRTWAPVGQTPTVRTSLDHPERLSLLGALLAAPGGQTFQLSVHSHRRTLRGDEVMAFLKALLTRVAGPIVLVWDNHPIHRLKKVQAFLADQPRLPVYHFPTAAPELNPMEWVWQQVDQFTASLAPRDRAELRTNVTPAHDAGAWVAGVSRVRHSQRRLRAGFLGAKLILGSPCTADIVYS